MSKAAKHSSCIHEQNYSKLKQLLKNYDGLMRDEFEEMMFSSSDDECQPKVFVVINYDRADSAANLIDALLKGWSGRS